MDHYSIINALEKNAQVFQHLLEQKPVEQQRWRPQPEKWSLLEIVCHLHDEEIEDFRTRVLHVLNKPDTQPPKIDPVVWVTERKYAEQDYDEKLTAFLLERKRSVAILKTLPEPDWKNSYKHPKIGTQTAEHYLANWLAHDHLHMRQMIRYEFLYLQQTSGADLSYAGNW